MIIQKIWTKINFKIIYISIFFSFFFLIILNFDNEIKKAYYYIVKKNHSSFNNLSLNFNNISQIPNIKLKISKKNFIHLNKINYNTENYSENNNWKKISFYDEHDKFYKGKFKSHGAAPDGHKSGLHISIRVKLPKNISLYGTRDFSLFVKNRLLNRHFTNLYFANSLGLIKRDFFPINIGINSNEYKPYVFVYLLNDRYMERIGKQSFKIIKNKIEKSSSSIKSIYNDKFFLKDYTLIANTDINNKVKDAINNKTSKIRKQLDENNFNFINSNFDIDYLARFDALRTLLGWEGHGFVSGNFYHAYNITNGKFYPIVTFDYNSTKLIKNHNPRLNFDTNSLNLLTNNYKDNDVLRYKKLLTYLNKDEKFIFKKKKYLHNIITNKKDILNGYKNFLKERGVKLNKNNYSLILSNFDYISENLFNKKNFQEELSIKKNSLLKKKEIIINKNMVFKEDLTINKDQVLKISSDINLTFINSSLVIHGSIETDDNRQIFNFQNNGGIYISCNENSLVKLSNLEINRGYSNVMNGIYFQGGLSVYNCENTKLINIKIYNSQAEDSININNSNFEAENITMENNLGDYLDIDNSTGVINGIFFVNNLKKSFGDGIDFSFSDVRLKDIYLTGFNDKALSIGENSKIFISDALIKNSKFGIALKDNSMINKTGVKFKDNVNNEVNYIKKHFYTTDRYLDENR